MHYSLRLGTYAYQPHRVLMQLRLKQDGELLFTDLDSTNGSYLNEEYLTPQEPTSLSLTESFKLSLGGSELVMSVVKRPG
jgi:hypothetical protein